MATRRIRGGAHAETSSTHDLIAISDLHLGGDLRRGFDHICEPPQDGPLVAMLDHHAPGPAGDRPWRLVIVGDMVDFIGINLVPDDETVAFAVSPEERTGGLRPEAAKAVWKLQQVVRRHTRFISRLARFVADGHALVVVAGNHDQEWSLPEVREALIDALVNAADHEDDSKHIDLKNRVSFRDWFHLEPGRAYFEHGHRYDEYCAPPDPPGRHRPQREPV